MTNITKTTQVEHKKPAAKNEAYKETLKKRKNGLKLMLEAFPQLARKAELEHPFALDSLDEFVTRRPLNVSVDIVLELYLQKTTSLKYLHLIRKRVQRQHINGGVAEDITDQEVAQAKFLLDEIQKDIKANKPKEERKPRKKSHQRDKITKDTPDYRAAHTDSHKDESLLAQQLKKFQKAS